uniref:Single-stranded-DNA-specific exonuclease RecJ n=1 Tax=candidate division WOR-3 bacterium TaxID=2052148 RepID=A0A7C4U7Z3_UNCW3
MRWKIENSMKINPPDNMKINPIVYSILKKRDMTDEEIIDFLNPDISKLESPFKFKDMEKSVQKILDNVESKKKIMIFGDYDVDGTTGTALLNKVIKRIGGDVIYYIPHRLKEGYGFSKNGVEYAKENNVSLIITVDCGIKAVNNVKLARDYGIDVIITDHHEVGEVIPDAFSIINPKFDDNYPFKYLAGVGVAFKLAQGIFYELKEHKNFLLWQLDLVATGTIADLAPLIGENRILTKYGLIVLNKLKKPGFKMLKEISGLKREIRSEDISFIIGPRMNALGRIAHANDTVRLLLTDNFEEAKRIALKMDYLNRERQETEKDIVEDAIEMIKGMDLKKYWSLILWSEDWHEGVIGIAASKLVEKYSRPTILCSVKDGFAKCSGRSIEGVHLLNALKECDEIFEEYGGHSDAAGMTLKAEKLEDFRERFNESVKKQMNEDMLEGVISIDLEIELEDINEELMSELKKLEPFGEDNPHPEFLLRGVKIVGYPELSSKYVRFLINKNKSNHKVVAFDRIDIYDEIKNKPFIDLVFNVLKSRDERIYLKLLDYKVCG